MNLRVNCICNDRGAWCKNKNIKRSLFGLGARCCIDYPDHIFVGMCKYREPSNKKTPFLLKIIK